MCKGQGDTVSTRDVIFVKPRAMEQRPSGLDDAKYIHVFIVAYIEESSHHCGLKEKRQRLFADDDHNNSTMTEKNTTGHAKVTERLKMRIQVQLKGLVRLSDPTFFIRQLHLSRCGTLTLCSGSVQLDSPQMVTFSMDSGPYYLINLLDGTGAPLGACTNGLAAPAGTGLPPNVHWMRQRCTNHTSPYHAWPNEDVCGQCYDITTGLASATAVYEALTKKSPEGRPDGNPMRAGDPSTRPWPVPVVGAAGTVFDAFWTRLCRPCERTEQERFARRIFDLNIGVPSPPSARQAWNYPMNLCTCIRAVGWPGPGQPPIPANHQPPQPPGGIPIAAVNVQPPVDSVNLPMAPAGMLKERYCLSDHLDIVNALLAAREANDQTAESALHLELPNDGGLPLRWRKYYCKLAPSSIFASQLLTFLVVWDAMGTGWSRHPRPRRSRRIRNQMSPEGPQPRGAGNLGLQRARGQFLDNRA
ncbi:uncharacterized protein MYCFIDRAFT_171789 [Pseudocercospora fijiensis CIRAD86]|uniref:Uncharacterized protein n=1 Tax=Pseudocercospora fijiensis (strain CIRAD86) TaxID=383855 RepID=M3AMX6_PSEFD|nr:uncharacterized protein MYCFIDRAFT_171789 [Pseudocercospora fijiensis CIRAD86]EME85951.1 hypothetical protein MYCFIDRAFT_171789 [Pseudocercospora fijiensis CIRAD86]